MQMHDLTYKKAIANAAALKALGQSSVYLYRDSEYPWHIAESCESGGTHRLDISTSVRFSGCEQGIEFSWSFDIETRDANGKGHYEIDMEGCKKVLAKLQGKARAQFIEYLASCAEKVKAQGDKYQTTADAQYRTAAVLRNIVNWVA
jgi:hypothetical protein